MVSLGTMLVATCNKNTPFVPILLVESIKTPKITQFYIRLQFHINKVIPNELLAALSVVLGILLEVMELRTPSCFEPPCSTIWKASD